MEPASYVVGSGRRRQSCCPLRPVWRGRARLVRLAGYPAAREACDRMGARDRSNEAEAARRRNPEGRAQRRHVCALGRMGSADRMPKEHPRYPQVRSADFLERESHITDPTLLLMAQTALRSTLA